MRVLFIIICLAFCLPKAGSSQAADSLYYLGTTVQDGEVIPHIDLNEISVFPKKDFKNKREERQYTRLMEKVKKVYPYAKVAAKLLREYDVKYCMTDDPKLQRKYVKQAEDDLFGEYGPELKKLTISEGRILIKLIDRETEHTSYELIKDLKGGLSAFFWQGIARIFGNDLKAEYDPLYEDRNIEEIIFYIDAGLI